jgi:hypothetical protein
MSATGLRLLLADSAPILFGQHPDRPAPAHVLNGFVAAALGVSSVGLAIRALLVPEAEVPDEFAFLGEADWARDEVAFTRFRDDLSTVFNPDRRLWEKFGSAVPVHALLASADASDDGYGPLIWELVRRHVDETEYAEQLRGLLEPAEPDDPISAVARVLVSGASVTWKRERPVADSVWFAANGSHSGGYLAERLAEIVRALSCNNKGLHRLVQIQHLARGVYFGAFLSLLLGPLAAARQGDASSAVDIAPIVAWGGTPPGPPGHPMVVASSRSFQMVVEANRQALLDLLRTKLSNVHIASTTPETQRRRSALRQALIDGGANDARADRTIEQFETGELDLGRGDYTELLWLRRLLDLGYSTAALTKAFRSTGRKVGVVAPDRGTGAPRFVLETPLLGTLVVAICEDKTLPFEDFVDAARDRLGLVLGPGTLTEVPILDLWESPGIARQQLRDNQDLLRVRLVRAGLATEYSDGHTEVGIA